VTTRTVFLSYARPDRGIVAPIANLIRGTAATVFRDEESILPGQKWELAIADAIHSCGTLLVFWSTAAARSKSVEREYRLAIGLEKRVVPVLLDDTPLVRVLAQYQWVDLRAIIRASKERSQQAVPGGLGATLGIPVVLITIPLTIIGMIAGAIRALGGQSGVHDVEFNESERRSVEQALLSRIVLL
jgi:hypothetical protein